MSDVARTWANEDLRRMKFDPETWRCSIDVDLDQPPVLLRYGIDTPLSEDTLLRLPVPVKAGSRKLDAPAWGDLPVMDCLVLCILHAGMRTSESLFALLNDVRELDSNHSPSQHTQITDKKSQEQTDVAKSRNAWPNTNISHEASAPK